MEILSFDISGKFAHFRKFFANNTALSYSIPPRTTVIGILAGIMGYEKEQYHEALSTDNLRHGIKVMAPLKKTFQRLNFLSIKGPNDFRGRGGRIQTPFEVVTGPDIRKDEVSYRTYLAPGNNGSSAFDAIKQRLLEEASVFNPTLGTANFHARIHNIRHFQRDQIQAKSCDNQWIKLSSSANVEDVQELAFEKGDQKKYNFVEEELLPADFVADGSRELGKMNRLLFTTDNIPLSIRFTGTYYEIEENQDVETIQLIE
jgi:CRISPR-associated protein Cas5h